MIGVHPIYKVCPHCGRRQRGEIRLDGMTDREVLHIKKITEVISESDSCTACGHGYYKFSKEELKGAEMPLHKDKGDWKKSKTPEEARKILIKWVVLFLGMLAIMRGAGEVAFGGDSLAGLIVILAGIWGILVAAGPVEKGK